MTRREKKRERERFEGKRKNIPWRVHERERKEQKRPLFAFSRGHILSCLVAEKI